MRKIFLRIFFAFWTATLIVLACTIFATLWLADQRTQRELARQNELASQASTVVSAEGIPGLYRWLETKSAQLQPDSLFILDQRGNDLLGRHVPPFLLASMGHGRFDAKADPRNVRLLSQLIAANDQTYSVALMHPPDRGPFGLLNLTETPIITGIATLLVSATLCFMLARYLSDPIRHLRAATRSIAQGNLGVRVASLVGRRRDELALLAVDFDVMAERLRSLLESQRQLLRDVSHELRSPLARLQIALGLARRPNANLEREFDRIEQETQRLDELIGEILSLSRLDDTSHALATEAVNLDELLETLTENARMEAEPRWIRVALRIDGPLVIEGDRELLFRAVENVVRNALRFSPNGSTVDLRAQRAGDEALVRISDQGPGVPPELVERIFEPFFRVGKARDRESGGHGIGLAITARVAILHGGRVCARNLAPHGLEVEIALPLRTAGRSTGTVSVADATHFTPAGTASSHA